jgi:general secretion pathway protein L
MALTDSLKLIRGGPWAGLGLSPLAGGGLAERLGDCLPATLRRGLAGRDRRLEAFPGESGSAALYLAAGETRGQVGELSLAGREPLPPQAIAGAKDRARRTVLLLPAEAVLTRRASFPAQVRENLPQAVRSELNRLSPFTPDQVLYDFRALPAAKGETRLAIELALCRRDRAEGWIKRMREAGSPVDQVAWEGAWPKANLLPPESRPRARRAWLDPARLLLGLVLLLAAAALATPIWQKTQALAALDLEVRKARGQAVQVDELRQELERAKAGSVAVLQRKWEEARMTNLLRELTERIPDDTWVQSLEYQNGEVQLRGESGQATALIGLLESAPGIEGVSFRSPVTQVARTGKERFNLAFAYKVESQTGAPPDGGAGPAGAQPRSAPASEPATVHGPEDEPEVLGDPDQ